MSAVAPVVRETPKDAARRFAASEIRDGFAPVALHVYTHPDGTPWFWRIRCKRADGEKWIRPMRLNGSGFELGEPEFPRAGKPLYGLHGLHARPGEPVYVVEGENKVDALAKLGILATTSGAADSAARADWSPLTARTVHVWPDADEAGARYAAAVIERLQSVAESVELVDVDVLGLPDSGDAIDWLAAHPGASASDVAALPRARI
jgi:hypothetical protein